jgi:hypothetical protein
MTPEQALEELLGLGMIWKVVEARFERKRAPNPMVPKSSRLGVACSDKLNGTVSEASWSCGNPT